jgi:tetratricopeptide (TPR) repeat protein
MSAPSPRTSPPKEAIDYAKKYWWIGVIVMPLVVVAVSKLWPEGKGTGSIPGNSVTSIVTVKNEFLSVTGQPLNDPALLKLIERAMEFTAKGQGAASIPLYQKALEQAPIPALYNNLGVAFAQTGNFSEAKKSLEQAVAKDPSYALAQNNLVSLNKPLITPVSDREIEPNDDVFHFNLIPLGKGILGEISPNTDVDTFQFETPGKSGVWIDITLDNQSTGFWPALKVLDAKKVDVLGWVGAPNPGADHAVAFEAAPGAKYFVQVASREGAYAAAYVYRSTGTYVLTVKPRNAPKN